VDEFDVLPRGKDSSGGGHDGVLARAIPVPGECGTALRFLPDDNVDEFTIPHTAALDLVGPMSAVARVRLRGTQSTDYNSGCTEGTIFAKGGSSWFQVERNNDRLVFQNEGSGSEVAVANVALPINTWISVGFVRGAMVSGVQPFQFYVDGNPVATTVTHNGIPVGGLQNLAGANTAPMMVGNYGFGNNPGACEFNGDIDEIRIYDRALLAEDMATIQACPCQTGSLAPCSPTSSLVINTGWDQSTGTTVQEGSSDNEWIVTSDPDPNTTEPRPAFVIPPYQPGTAWALPAASSSWLSSYPTSENDRNGHYVFDYPFCLLNTTGASLSMCLRADDVATVSLNGTPLGATGLLSFRPANPCVAFTASASGGFVAGQNVLRVDVENTQSVAMGLDLTGTIQGNVPRYEYCCSESTAALAGTVWNDNTYDSKKDPTEPRLAGWTVNLSNGMTTTSDGLGNYYFRDLPAGTYTISMPIPSGWNPMYPHRLGLAAGVHALILDNGESRSELDFGVARLGDRPRGDDDLPILRQLRPLITPNPAHAHARIAFETATASDVRIEVFDVAGRVVRDLSPGRMGAGKHEVLWDGSVQSGERARAGIYFVRVRTGDATTQARVVLVGQ
jgi:hypothetical protein